MCSRTCLCFRISIFPLPCTPRTYLSIFLPTYLSIALHPYTFLPPPKQASSELKRPQRPLHCTSSSQPAPGGRGISRGLRLYILEFRVEDLGLKFYGFGILVLLIAHFSGNHLEVQSGNFPSMDFYGIGG